MKHQRINESGTVGIIVLGEGCGGGGVTPASHVSSYLLSTNWVGVDHLLLGFGGVDVTAACVIVVQNRLCLF